MAEVERTWATRELPILRAALRRLDAGDQDAPLEEIRQETGLSSTEVRVAVHALMSAEPPYIKVTMGMGSWKERAVGEIDAVTERTRRELGSWPSAETLVSQLVAALNEAAEREQEPERKSRLRAAADALGGFARDVAVQVVATRLGQL